MDVRRLRIWEWLTGLAGLALLLLLFVEWYELGVDRSVGVNAWESFAVLDVVLAIVALMAIAVAVMAAVHNTPAVSLAIASLLLTIGTLTFIALAVRAIFEPTIDFEGIELSDEYVTRSIGLWLGLATTALLTLGSFGCMRDERFPRAARADVPVETLPPPEGGTA
ncbi:MAG TPA: hypothetical protein VF715_15050 [Thermoleophilaceae bacterium]